MAKTKKNNGPSSSVIASSADTDLVRDLRSVGSGGN